MSKTYRDYSIQDKAAALAWLEANGGNVAKTARDLKMPQKTLDEWSRGNHVDEEIGEKRDVKKRELGELFEECARLYLERAMDTGAIGDTRGKDAVIAAATAFDKHQLTIGAPTSINQDIGAGQKLVKLLKNRGNEDISLEEANEIMAESFKRGGLELEN